MEHLGVVDEEELDHVYIFNRQLQLPTSTNIFSQHLQPPTTTTNFNFTQLTPSTYTTYTTFTINLHNLHHQLTPTTYTTFTTNLPNLHNLHNLHHQLTPTPNISCKRIKSPHSRPMFPISVILSANTINICNTSSCIYHVSLQ